MKDIKNLTIPQNVYLEEFDINVRPYLGVAEIEAIGEDMLKYPNELLQELRLIINVLNLCTDIPKEYLIILNEDETENEDFLGFDLIIQSGLWGAVETEMVSSIEKVWEYVWDLENKDKAIARFVAFELPKMSDKFFGILEGWAKKLPRGKQWNDLITNLPNQLKEVLNTMKDDGNAEIIANAMKMNEVGVE